MRGDRAFAEAVKLPPFNRLHPQLAGYFKQYVAAEKVVRFGDQYVLNTNFPPYPGRAFDNLVSQFRAVGDGSNGHLYSVTLAVTNRCTFNCWHCYNAGRSERDLPLERWTRLAAQVQASGAVMVTLTGGEPLLRPDLERIAGAFDGRSCVIVGTTGSGLTRERARALRTAGVFGAGISLDSDRESEHDRMRGRTGAFREALDALAVCREEGLYAYVVAVATHDLLLRERFLPFMRFAAGAGALEVHLLEPIATGRLSGRTDVLLSAPERRIMVDYQRLVAADERLPILSSFIYLESPEAFGCGAGLTHLYIDGAGEVCPCNLVPLSFGNVGQEDLPSILVRMRRHFRQPRASCIGRTLARHVPDGPLPTPPELSQRICEERLPVRHAVPRFFALRAQATSEVGQAELRAAYDRVNDDYDAFWLSEAGTPIVDLIAAIPWRGTERSFEAGCGTGYATARLAERAGSVVAVDLSPGMLRHAEARLGPSLRDRVELEAGDALERLVARGAFDVVFSSWVLGYIPLAPFFAAARRSLVPGGILALVVHRENSPREPLEVFGELVAEDPSVLLKRVAFDFPRDGCALERALVEAGFEVRNLSEGSVTFRCRTPDEVLEHLLKSGAGTAYFEAVDPGRRERLTRAFLDRLSARHAGEMPYDVIHDYVACVAVRR